MSITGSRTWGFGENVLTGILGSPLIAGAARVVLCLPFWWSGLTKLFYFSGGTAEMADLGLPMPGVFNALTIVVQLGGSVLVIANIQTWLGAGALGVFTAMATLLAHQFWRVQGLDRARQLDTFLEHLAIIAGFVLAAILSHRAARYRT